MIICIISGQCGFPGRPLNGRVYRVEDSLELGAFGQNDLVEEIGEDWNQQELYRVAFRCDNDPLMGSDGEKNRYRDCIDGKWTGENPLCGELRA